jgi:pyruvate,water dikinase
MSEVEAILSEGLRARHEALRDLLDRNGDLLELLAEVQLDLRLLVPGDPVVRTRTLQLLEATLLQVENLDLLSGGRYRRLYQVHAAIESEIRRVLGEGRQRLRSDPLIVPLAAGRPADQALVGGKAARLGRVAARLGERVPDGFVVTTAACARLLAHGQTSSRLRELMRRLDLAADPARLAALAAEARRLVLEAPIPREIEEEIAERASETDSRRSWAVRSSAVGEDGFFSFAGQFESLLHVPSPGLPSAWRQVVASSFSEHVIRYRVACGLFEVTTPMAVLFMPMVAARVAGVLYTRDPAHPDQDTMLVSAGPGSGGDLVGGVVDAETCRVSRVTLAVEERLAPASGDGGATTVLSEGELASLVRLGLEVEAALGEALDVEWAIEGAEPPVLLQARPLRAAVSPATLGDEPAASCLLRGGLTIVGGRAVGRAFVADTLTTAARVPDGAILVVPQAVPELGHLLPRIEGLVAEHGSLAGHLASLAREFGVPSVFGMRGARARLEGGETISLDAVEGTLYEGEAWPSEGREARRRARELRSGPRGPLHELILHLRLTDPASPWFRPGGCRSLHDIVRLCHERGVAALFEDGRWRDDPSRAGALRLRSAPLPDGIWVLDAGGGLAPGDGGAKELASDRVLSRPFGALWRGMTTPGITWAGRRRVDLRGFASVVASSLTEADRGADTLGGGAYLILASDYLNFNARMAYHYAMIDAVVGEGPESNDVRFRFWGGGAGRVQRDLRAVFLAEVLQRSGFTVERRGDLVTARKQRQSSRASEEGLETLGRLMGCARQLDMLIHSEETVAAFVESFLAGRYEEFA